MDHRVRNKEKEEIGVAISLSVGVLISYLVTGVLLLLLALLLYQFELNSKQTSIAIIIIYGVSTLVAGLFVGKKIGSRKFLWGSFSGVLYFAVLLLVSVIVNHSIGEISTGFFGCMVLCTGCGMLGGMLG